MSWVGLISGGYLCIQAGDVIRVLVDELTGTITEEDCLKGTIADDVCPPAAFEISSFSVSGGNIIEIGTPVATPAFTASYLRPPVTAVLTNNANAESKSVISTPAAFTSDQTYQLDTPGSVSWVLTAADGASDAASTAIFWRARLYVGWTTSPGPYTEADIFALNELDDSLDANALFDFVLSPTNAPSGAYLVAAYHDVYNGAVASDFEIGNFGNGDVTEVQTGVSISNPGGTASYSVARSDFAVEAPGGIRFARET